LEIKSVIEENFAPNSPQNGKLGQFFSTLENDIQEIKEKSDRKQAKLSANLAEVQKKYESALVEISDLNSRIDVIEVSNKKATKGK
jgi:hypothetical protein